MTRNSHGRKSKKPQDDGPGVRIHDIRRAYKRSRVNEEWQTDIEEAGVEELEGFGEYSDMEYDELDSLDEFIEPEEEEHR